MIKSDKPKIMQIHMKTMYKLIFFISSAKKKMPKLEARKARDLQADVDVAQRLLNLEPVTTSEYQNTMSRIKKTIDEEETFHNYMRR